MRSVFARSYVAAPPRVPRAQRGQCPSLLRSSVRPSVRRDARGNFGCCLPSISLPLLHDVGADNKDVCRSLQATTTATAGQSFNNTCCLDIIPASSPANTIEDREQNIVCMFYHDWEFSCVWAIRPFPVILKQAHDSD